MHIPDCCSDMLYCQIILQLRFTATEDEKMSSQCMLILLAVLSTHPVYPIHNVHVYHVSPDGEDTVKDGNEHTLQHYVNNSIKYFKSYTEFHFKPGQHYLNTDMLIRDINNFTFIGIHTCNITCTASSSVVMYNCHNITFKNINFKFENELKYYSRKKYSSFTNNFTKELYQEVIGYNGSILFYHCASVMIENIKLMTNAGVDGIVAINVKGNSTFTDNTITLKWSLMLCSSLDRAKVNGIKIYYNTELKETKACTFHITNFLYLTETSMPCLGVLQYAIKLRMKQTRYNVSVAIQNVLFQNLANSCFLHYRGFTCGQDTVNILNISNLTIAENVGFEDTNMIKILFNHENCNGSSLDYSIIQYHKQQYI